VALHKIKRAPSNTLPLLGKRTAEGPIKSYNMRGRSGEREGRAGIAEDTRQPRRLRREIENKQGKGLEKNRKNDQGGGRSGKSTLRERGRAIGRGRSDGK